MDAGDRELALAQAEALSGLLQAVGYAVWQAAECEDALASWVAIALRPTRGVGEEAAAPILDSVHRRTLGQLFRELENNAVLEPSILSRLKKLIEERNWLVHYAKRETRGVLNNPHQFDRVAGRIKRIGVEAARLQAMLGKKLEDYVHSSGVDPKEIEREAARLQAEWGYDL
jgi:hypothetical protein